MKNAKGFLRMLGLLLAWNVGPAAAGALQWERTSVEQTLPAGTDLVEVRFPFSNPENHAVSILHLQPSCGCTTPTVDKYTFAPGEKSVVTALFDAKGLSGLQEKTIQVDLDDQSKPVTLTLRMTIPAWAEISPRVLSWAIGEEARAKEAKLTLDATAKAKVTLVQSDPVALDAKLVPFETPGHYRLIVTPVSTAKTVQATVTVTLEVTGSAPRHYLVLAQVR